MSVAHWVPSNHMKNYEEQFTSLREPEQLRYVETDDATIHTIEHVSDVPLSHVGQRGCMKDVLHVQTMSAPPCMVKGRKSI